MDLYRIQNAIISDINDLENIGVVFENDSGKRVIPKGKYATARYVLDKTIENAINSEIPSDVAHNVIFISDETIYSLDTASGYFSREQGGETINNKVDYDMLRKVCIELGIFDFLAQL